MSFWSNLPKINMQLNYLNDGLTFARDMMRPKKQGESFADKMTKAGIDLFANTEATRNAANLRYHTGSNLGYMGKFAAGDNAEQALYNTTQASLYEAQFGMMFNNRGCCHHAGSYWDSSPYSQPLYFPNNGILGFSKFNSGFFNSRGWFR